MEDSTELESLTRPDLERRRGDTRIEIVEPTSPDVRGSDAALAASNFSWSGNFLRGLRTDSVVPSSGRLSSMKPKVRSFYVHQGRVLDSFEEVERLGPASGSEDDSDRDLLLQPPGEGPGQSVQHGGRQYAELDDNQRAGNLEPGSGGESPTAHRRQGARQLALSAVQQATYASLLVNVLLFGLKIAALVLSDSLSVLSSLVDSALDLFTGIVLFVTQRMMRPKTNDVYKYPAGKRRIEPVAIVICACVMGTASLQLIIASAQSIVKGDAKPNVKGLAGAILGISVLAKLALYLFCRRINNPSVQALAIDHRNDTMSNAIAIVFGLLGTYVRTWIDPLGGIFIAIYIIVNWIKAGKEQAEQLVGKGADASVLQQLTFAALQHSTRILQVDTVRAYHFGTNFIVEVHLVLPETMQLKEAHDIGESLQIKLEKLSHVERAFVHLDFESQHRPSDEHMPPDR
ncbi:uncharacterized protein LOC135828258 [Sycon ciliatum]|uniref:uncharacterized protein LOC135828258 n=1 Tax=Sycon ciliatum TaxID=27933 RepID=UPI0031F710C3